MIALMLVKMEQFILVCKLPASLGFVAAYKNQTVGLTYIYINAMIRILKSSIKRFFDMGGKMICPRCKMQWAPFPKEDFIQDDEGIHTRSEGAETRRLEVYRSDTEEYCGCAEDDPHAEPDVTPEITIGFKGIKKPMSVGR